MQRIRPSARRSARSPLARHAVPALLLAVSLLLLLSCGGGGSDSPAATAVTGTVYASPVDNASVVARNSAGAVVAGPALTGADGSYTLSVPGSALAGELRFESSGGTFVDEATGQATTGGRLAAFVPAGTLGAGAAVHLTPVSTLAERLVTRDRTLDQVRTMLTETLGFADNSSVGPRNDNAAAVGGPDNVARRLAALRAMAFSQLANDLGLSPDNQFNLVAAMGNDLSDNVMDGRNGTDNVEILPGVPLPEDIQNRFGNALARVYANTAVNRTGLTADQIGTPPCGTVAFTASYRVEYVPVTAPMMGRSRIDLRVRRLSDNTAVTDLVPGSTLRLVPWMYMSSKSHSSPIDNGIVNNGDGSYSFTIYYLMASANGPVSMGFWELKFLVNGEEALFHPHVGMPSGDTPRAVLKGTNDNAASSPVAARSYFLFKDGAVTGTAGSHVFYLFLAAYDNQSTYPQLQEGTTLRDALGAPWTVTDVTVEVSTDNVAWAAGTNTAGEPRWAFALADLAAPVDNVYVRLFVNGEQKTTDGFVPAGGNGYATFSVPVP